MNSTEDEFHEMEAWLGATGGSAGSVGAVSSSEFDDFLASRLGNDNSGAARSDGAAGTAAAPSPAVIRSIGDVPSISATSGAVPRVSSKKEDDQDLLLG